MSRGPREVVVRVYLDSIEPLQYRLESDELPIGTDGRFKFQNRYHRGFQIHFELQPPTYNYLFPKQADVQEALWSERGENSCPSSGIWQGFRPIRVENNGMRLVVLNPNPHPAEGHFGFVLRLTKDNGATYLPLDPGGDNMNGPWSFESYLIAPTVAGMVAGLVATWMAHGAAMTIDLVSGLLVGALVGLGIGFVFRMLGRSSPDSELSD